MNVFEKVSDIRWERWREPERTWGLVPTMGYLHEGHLSLVRRAKSENDKVGVSIFVNPMQFNNAHDLKHYPHDLQRDLNLLSNEGVDLVWTPTPEQVYPPGFQTYVTVEHLTQPQEGAARPGHFKGVATVVAKLFHVFQPHRAYFGQKDAQQLLVVRKMVSDLNFNLHIIACPTVREPDGLAMSSRNARLTGEARAQANCLFRALLAAREAYMQGEHDSTKIKTIMHRIFQETPKAKVEYTSVADIETLQEVAEIFGTALISLAVFIDDVRLIDNILLHE